MKNYPVDRELIVKTVKLKVFKLVHEILVLISYTLCHS